MLRRVAVMILCCCLLACLVPAAFATEQTARDISDSSVFSGGDFKDYEFLTNGDETTFFYTGTDLTVENSAGIGSLYLVFDQPCGYEVFLPASEKTLSMDSGFLHDFISLESAFDSAPTSVTLQFPGGASLCELRVFSPGAAPDTVQQWSQPLEGCADIVLFSTHGDDEQLYFAGLLPYYAGEQGLGVQVVYMTGHDNLVGSLRKHEMLNGLWAVGVRAYPVFGPFPDFKILDRDKTYAEYENLGISRADLLRFVVGNLRRFRPQVAVGHDLQGEYGHGMHRVYADLLTQAVELSHDEGAFPEQAEQYGVWDVPKTYLHLYPENTVVMDWDQPLATFDGMTAFEVTQKQGFPCHISQQYDLYTHWLYGKNQQITKASQITQWSPCQFGLYRSTVGADTRKNDFMENLTPYERQPETDPAVQTLQEEPPQTAPSTAPTVHSLPTQESAPSGSGIEPITVAALLGMALSAAAFAVLLRNKNFFEKM